MHAPNRPFILLKILRLAVTKRNGIFVSLKVNLVILHTLEIGPFDFFKKT